MNELDRILDGLIQRTSDGKLKWRRAASDDQFATSVDTISVVIGKSNFLQGGWPDQPRLEIYNELGDLAEVIPSDDDSPGELAGVVQLDAYSPVERQQKLVRLHELARRSALNTQATLEKLARALET